MKNLRNEIRKIIKEYVVPMGYSLDSWQEKKKKDDITNKEYAEATDGDKWKVVHGKTRPNRKGKKGRKLSSTKRGEPVNKSSVNLSYDKATKMHSAIELGENIDPYKNHKNQSYQLSNKKNMHLDKPTSHGYMSHDNRGWVDKRPVNDIIYAYLKKMGLIE